MRAALIPTLMISRASMADPKITTPSSRRTNGSGYCRPDGRLWDPYAVPSAFKQSARGLPCASPKRQGLWVPACAGTTSLLALHRLALDKRLAALHLVGQRRLVDLDHDGIGLDAEVFHQRLGDVAHHAGLLLIGSAGGHADGNFRHLLSLPLLLLRHSCHKHERHPEEPRIFARRLAGSVHCHTMVRDGARAPPHHDA